MPGNSSSNDAIERACKSFQSEVKRFIANIEKRRDHRGEETISDDALHATTKLVHHSNHVLRTLTAKRTTLKHAIGAFKDASNEYVRQFATLINQGGAGGQQDVQLQKKCNLILRKWFANYIRIRDGFVLLESGERRHPHDGDDANGVNVSEHKFPSKLRGAVRKDGVTRKFSSAKGYTGAGYDEFYDEDVGIKRRLLDRLSQMDGRRSRDRLEEKLFDSDMSGARVWETEMDNHINDSTNLREELNAIQRKFVTDMNKHLLNAKNGSGGSNRKSLLDSKLKLVTDDKSERITLGLVDIARQGNAFTISDEGGSLPFGMTEKDWRDKFSLVQQQKSTAKSTNQGDNNSKVKKKRKVIEDSSDEDEDNAAFVKPSSSTKGSKKQSAKPNSSAKKRDGSNGDGLAVRVREATDLSERGNKITTSVDEMKRQLGVNKEQLQQSHDHVEEEQLRSKMAADDEDMQAELLGDGKDEDLVVAFRGTFKPLLEACSNARAALRKNDAYNPDFEVLRESEEYWANYDSSYVQWKESFRDVLSMRKDIAGGVLEASSDQYAIREDFRESNMQLGIDSLDIHDYFSGQLNTNQGPEQNGSGSSSLKDSLLEICQSYLELAERVFKTALDLVLEHEKYQAGSQMTIEKYWEKGIHILLRGRAHINTGRAIYEQAMLRHQSGGRKNMDVFMKARKEFDNALSRAKSLRHNTVLISGHHNANDKSTQNNLSWTAEAKIHSLEAMKLEALSSGLHIACSWNMGRIKEAEERFDGFYTSVEVSKLLQFVGAGGVSHEEVHHVLFDMYWVAVRFAELSVETLEKLPTKKEWNAKSGDAILLIIRKALKRTATMSDHLFAFSRQNEGVVTKSAIENELDEIRKWWETTKVQAQRKLADVVQGGFQSNASFTHSRTAVTGDARSICGLQRKIFIQDGRSLQRRSEPSRARQINKNYSDNAAVSARFNSAFGSDNNASFGGDASAPMEIDQGNTPTYRKWGNEVLQEHEQKRYCPPLPAGLTIDVMRALQKRLDDILPPNNKLLGCK